MVWEERWHPLRLEWVVVSSHRQNRPWQGETVGGGDEPAPLPAYVPDCYLCPGNARVSGRRNEVYESVYVFDNDHPCVGPAAPEPAPTSSGLYQSRRANGLARVVCYSPRHDLTLPELAHEDVVRLLQALQEQQRDLMGRPGVQHVLMFENKGAVTGVSNPHPHCQIYATNFAFRTMAVEAEASARYLATHGRPLFRDIILAEEGDGRRLVARRGDAVAFVPYFARYPYETFVAPRETHASIADLSRGELDDFAGVLKEVVVRMDNLWRMSFPYVMVLHQAPASAGARGSGFHFYIQIIPPLRKPGLLKYLAGPEIGGGNFLNDAAPENTAAELRAVPEVHYRGAPHG
jgi:UDPglucose--hexose-1-phosphate uridylyltransferase